jgi:hypothetical protein
MERRTLAIIGTTIAVFVGVILVWAFSGDNTLSASLTEVTDSATIENHVQVSRVGIATGENYIGHKIRVIGGLLTNSSDKAVRMVELKMVFLDYDGKPIQESNERAFDISQKPLLPGGKYRFEVNFENLPRTWNHRIPNIEVVKIAY